MNVNEAISKAQKLMTDQTFWDKVNAVDNRQGKKTVGYEPNMFEHKQAKHTNATTNEKNRKSCIRFIHR